MCSRRRNAPSVPASLQRSASASNRRFSLPRELAAPGDRNDLRVTARAFARGHLSSCPTGSFRDSLGGRTRQSIQRRFHQRGHVHVYLYSKLPETGVSPHIGTGGSTNRPARRSGAANVFRLACVERAYSGGQTSRACRDNFNPLGGPVRYPNVGRVFARLRSKPVVGHRFAQEYACWNYCEA